MNYPHIPAIGKTDTSAAAAPSLPQAKALQRRVLFALSHGPSTADEVAARIKESVLAVRPRFTELSRVWRIEDTGERRKNASGRNAIVWQLSDRVSAHVSV